MSPKPVTIIPIARKKLSQRGVNKSMVFETIVVHMHIGQEIAKFEGNNTISRIEKMSWSENIHNKPSECTAWVKN